MVIKIGGSVLTEKGKDELVVRREVIKGIARELKNIWMEMGFRFVIIHGAGSAGHPVVRRYNLQEGLIGSVQRLGVMEVQRRLAILRCELIEEFLNEGLPVFSVNTSSIITSRDGDIVKIFIDPIIRSLELGFMPILSGDIVFDEEKGVAICSGDKLSFELAMKLNIKLIVFGVDVDGIYPSPDLKGEPIRLIHYGDLSTIVEKIGGSKGIDVTGGMKGKILEALSHPAYFKQGGEVWILNMLKRESLIKALNGEGNFTKIVP